LKQSAQKINSNYLVFPLSRTGGGIFFDLFNDGHKYFPKPQKVLLLKKWTKKKTIFFFAA